MQSVRLRYSDYFSIEPLADGIAIRPDPAAFQDNRLVQDLALDLYALMDQLAKARLVLDMAGVDNLSSEALGVLVDLEHKARAAGGSLLLANVDRRLAHMLRITRLDGLLAFQERSEPAEDIPCAPGCCRMSGMVIPPERAPTPR